MRKSIAAVALLIIAHLFYRLVLLVLGLIAPPMVPSNLSLAAPVTRDLSLLWRPPTAAIKSNILSGLIFSFFYLSPAQR